MITIANFSHPIAKSPALSNLVGAGPDDIRIIDIPTYVDQAAGLVSQASALVDQAVDQAQDNVRNIDIIRLPGLADLAVAVFIQFQQRGYVPNLIRITRTEDSVPPQFDAVELIKYYNYK